MSRWIDNSLADRLYMVNLVTDSKNIDQESVEKDWWVSMVLKCLFELSMSKYMFFKGGTSLSKGWDIINRFSEDIDIALYRDFFADVKGLDCAQCENNNQIKSLRKASRDYILCELSEELKRKLAENNVLDVKVEPVTTVLTSEGEKPIDHDSDPTVINVHYKSMFKNVHKYVKSVVKIEISCLSMKDPYEVKRITSLISKEFDEGDNETFADIPTISPSRTFLEKVFLLNEEYQRNNPRTLRMSRHLYDLEKLMQTLYCEMALTDAKLYHEIVEHRRKFYHVGYVDYDKDMPSNIQIVPTEALISSFEADYNEMKKSFIYGQSLDFADLMARIKELQDRFRAINC